MKEIICVSKLRNYKSLSVEPSCSKCKGTLKKKSSYEQQVCQMLDGLGIDYIFQKTAYGCKNPRTGRSLIFDFYIPAHDTYIEVNGPQHYYSVTNNYFNYEEINFRDNVKREWCKRNKHNFVRLNHEAIKKLSPCKLQALIER